MVSRQNRYYYSAQYNCPLLNKGDISLGSRDIAREYIINGTYELLAMTRHVAKLRCRLGWCTSATAGRSIAGAAAIA